MLLVPFKRFSIITYIIARFYADFNVWGKTHLGKDFFNLTANMLRAQRILKGVL